MSVKFHLFIDTSTLLSFYNHSKDHLEQLKEVFPSYQKGSLHIQMTRQVIDEFRNNRVMKIQDAMSQFQKNILELQPPLVLLNYDEMDRFNNLRRELNNTQQEILDKAGKDINDHDLEADKLITDIINHHSSVSATSDDIVELAKKRQANGKPPGTKASMGNVINWLLLLRDIPEKEDLHLISTDNGFFASLAEETPDPILMREWKEAKSSDIHVYRTIYSFLKTNRPRRVVTDDTKKNQLIKELSESSSFATSNYIVARLDRFVDFSLDEVKRILKAALTNSQVGGIISEVSFVDLLERIALPLRSEIKEDEQIKILDDLERRVAAWDN